MKNLFSIIAVLGISCTSQKNASTIKLDTAMISPAVMVSSGVQATTTSNPADADILMNAPQQTGDNKKVRPNTPQAINSHKKKIKSPVIRAVPSQCIKKLIGQFMREDVQNPPRKIYSYTYEGKTVYYVTPPCCDFFSDLYDSDCKIIAHPDGGITGRGDGRAKDFVKSRKNEKLVWEDSRKYR